MALTTFTAETLAISGPSAIDLTVEELIDLIPVSWTSAEAKQRGGFFWALINGLAQALGAMRAAIGVMKAQLRIATAAKSGLETIAVDFFGNDSTLALPRSMSTLGNINVLESDNSYRARIQAELLQERATINGIIKAVEMITGAAPTIIEPFNPQNFASWGGSSSAGTSFNAARTVGAYGAATTSQFQTSTGTMGSTNPQTSNSGYGDAGVKYTFIVQVTNNPAGASLAAITAIVNRVKPVGVIAIVQLGA